MKEDEYAAVVNGRDSLIGLLDVSRHVHSPCYTAYHRKRCKTTFLRLRGRSQD